ncbi:oxidoreductase [Myxococcus llanfairpwllgwyngyllgogerychwyrndrobwllllantysiliogogogochensis]|uniref:Oxidoreductase n=1 Tax=Myxococcus llanfairpwllgwyngyllgogerychwyrndrobwllllantysiliogogogochensis TaxID=2590453 RepID=A0A540WUX1_9BACT|nr:oxidoreductase [Myxococcus llanfairpwllgwyngyllgogerychwyrndrobwllllantysiliogogogochensis]
MLGYGFAGKSFHAPLLRTVEGLSLRTVASSRPDDVHADLPDVTVIPAARDAATHPDVDLVVVATPNETHVPLTEAALRAGKHVVVDKPFTITLAEARALSALAHERGRVLSVFHNRRWDSDFLALKALLTDGTLGRVTHVESRFDRFRPEVRQRWREQPVPGAGIWFDLGPHLVDQVLQLFGLPDTVVGMLAAHRDGAAVDDWCQVTLVYPQRHVVLQASMLIAGGLPRFAVHGTRGSWLKYGMDTQADRLIAGELPGASDWGEDATPGRVIVGGSSEARTTSTPRGDYRHFYAGIRDAVRGTRRNPVTPLDAVAVAAVLDAAVLSSRTGRACTLDLTSEERGAFSDGCDLTTS